MGFKVYFELGTSHRLSGFRFYSFVLKNTDWFGSETIDCMISDEYGQQPWYFRDQKLKTGRSYRFDFDTVNWTWCQHDFFAIFGKNDKILQKWQLNLKEYGPGECPECHGTLKCKFCNGQGYLFNSDTIQVKMCKHCGGTGTCQRCDIPYREGRMGGRPTGIGNGFK